MPDTTGDAVALPTQHQDQAQDPTSPATPLSIERISGRFAPGQSGNPQGRIPGSRNRATLAAESLMEGEAEALSGKAVALALGGDSRALKLCVERILPPLKSRIFTMELPAIQTPADVSAAITKVIEATTTGQIDADQARALTTLIEMKRKSIETIELEDRLRLIEKKVSRDVRAIPEY